MSVLPAHCPPGEGPPPLPSPAVVAGAIWPATAGRQILAQVPLATARPRGDLVGRQGREEGSGTSDLFLLQAGPWCLKTSIRRFHRDRTEGGEALVELARRKLALGDLRARDTALVLAEDPRGVWLWTVAPWMPTLRGQMRDADEAADEAALTTALVAFAEAALASLALALRQGLALDVHPSNFGSLNERTCYLDDDIAKGDRLPALGHALLRRVEEYAHRPAAVESYLATLERRLAAALTPAQAATLNLDDSLHLVAARSDLGREARDRLARAVSGRPARKRT